MLKDKLKLYRPVFLLTGFLVVGDFFVLAPMAKGGLSGVLEVPFSERKSILIPMIACSTNIQRFCNQF